MTSHKHAQQRGIASEIAQALGVSRAAVSYALNGRPGVSEELRAKILGEAQRRGLEIRRFADSTDVPLLGLILADVGNQFYSEFAVSASDAARRAGAELLLSHTADEKDSIRSAVRAMLSHGVSGIVLTVANAHDASLMPMLRAAGVSCVQVSRKSPHLRGAFVGMDDFLAGREVMSHLLEHGYRDLCIAVGPLSSSSSTLRAKGMLEAAHEAGVNIPKERIIRTRLSSEGGEAVARYLLAKGDLPEAICCGTDAIALALISELFDKGVKCPEQVAVTGYDGLVTSLSRIVGLTTIVQPRAAMAEAAISILLQTPTVSHSKVDDVICPHYLSIGRTCGC